MRYSRSLFNFAIISCIAAMAFSLEACKGRTMENMEPSGETVEVVILQDTATNISNTNF